MIPLLRRMPASGVLALLALHGEVAGAEPAAPRDVKITAEDIAVPPGTPLDAAPMPAAPAGSSKGITGAPPIPAAAPPAPALEEDSLPSSPPPPAAAAPAPSSNAVNRMQVETNRAKTLQVNERVSWAVVTQDEATKGSLDEIRAQYQVVRKVFGGEHALITAGAYIGERCNRNDGSAHSLFGNACGKERRAGVAGIVMVPLLGAGGGHGVNFWPVVQTDDELQAFLQFQQSLQLHGDALAATFAVFSNVTQTVDSAADLAARVRTFRESLKEEFQREVDTKGAHAELAERFLRCLDQIEAANLGLKLEWESLSRLWQEYGGILENVDNIARRHNLLIGPFVGAPITEDPAKVIMFGMGAEVGTQGFRVTLGGGVTADYSSTLVPVTGWVASIGLSGQWGDDLLHYLSGAKDLANGLKKVGMP